VATSSQQFFRTIGGTVAIAVLGAVLNSRLTLLLGAGANTNAALDLETRSRLSPAELEQLVTSLAAGLKSVYIAFIFIAAAAVVVSLYFPRGRAAALAHPDTRSP
jgi:hypothetical protein